MKITILGAGVIGLTTAYCLTRDGHQVEVLERNTGVGLETSFANGAQLAYSYVAPLAGPGVLPKVPPWLLRRDSPMRFRPALDPHQWRWLAAFVLACNRVTADLTTRRLLRLSFLSRDLMHAFLAEESIDFGYANSGKLVVHSDAAGFDAACRLLEYQRELGCEQEALDRAACVALEPALGDPESALAKRLVGGILTRSEEVGDCYRFCIGLEQRLRSMGVAFRFGTAVERLRTEGMRVTGVETSAGPVSADAWVLTLGSASPFLVRPLGFHLPIYPLKGYSLTLNAGARAPRISITDFKRKVVYAPVDGSDRPLLRVAGMADIVGHSRQPDPARLAQLFEESVQAFPGATDYRGGVASMAPWAGLRPATPTGMPILGPSPYSNLFLNCGHGALGWTLALGSAKVVADGIAGRPPPISVDGFTL